MKGFSYLGTQTILANVFTITYQAGIDLYAGYETNFFELKKNQNVFQPTFYLEAASHGYVTANLLNYFQFTITGGLEVFRADPLNI